MRARRIVRAGIRDERGEEGVLVGEVFGDGEEVIGDDGCLGLQGGPVFVGFTLAASFWRVVVTVVVAVERYHEGSGSLVFKLVTRELKECVSWTRRWRDCSRALTSSWVGEVILLVAYLGFFWCS